MISLLIYMCNYDTRVHTQQAATCIQYYEIHVVESFVVKG